MGNSWAQEERKESIEFPDRDICPDHNSSNSLSCSCSFCCSRSSVINCDRNETLMQVSSNLSERQTVSDIWNADVSQLQDATRVTLRKTESEIPHYNYFDTQLSKESVANKTYDLADCSLQKDETHHNTQPITHHKHKYDSRGEEVCKSYQMKEATGAFCLPSRENRSLHLSGDFCIERNFQDKLVCSLETREDDLVLEKIRSMQASFENYGNLFSVFNVPAREGLLGTNLIGSIPFGGGNLYGDLHNFNTQIFAKDMMERMNMTPIVDGSNLFRQSEFVEASSQSHVLDETLMTNALLSDKTEKDIPPLTDYSLDKTEKDIPPLTDDYSLDAIEGVFIGIIDKVDKQSTIASFQWKNKRHTAVIYRNKIEYRGRKVGKKLNIDELLVTGQHVTLHIKSNSKTKEGNLIASCVMLDVENKEELKGKNCTMSPLYLTTINSTLACSSFQATIESVFNTWGTLSFMRDKSNKKAIFVSENVYINDFNVPKESALNLVLYEGMPAICDVNSYNCDIIIKLCWFVGEIVELTNNVGVISFVMRSDQEKAVILAENLYVNREKFTSSDLYDVLQLKDKVAFLCVPSETRYKATYLILCSDRQNVTVNFGASNDQYHYFIDLLASCQTKCEKRVNSGSEKSTISYNTANRASDFNIFAQSKANFIQASESFMQRWKHFKKCSMSEQVQENNDYYSLLNALRTALVFGGLMWNEYTHNKFEKGASSAFNVNTIRALDITGTVCEEGLLISGEMKILFHINDVYVNGEKCSHVPLGSDLHCTATELPHRGCRGETHFAWCLWQGTRPSVQHVFNVFEFRKSDAVTLKENKPYKGQVVAVYPPNAVLVRLYVGVCMVPVVVFSNFLQDRMCPFSFEGDRWIIDYINIGDCLYVSVQPTKKSNKVAKLGYQWSAVSARKTCPCGIKPQKTKIFSRCKSNHLQGSVSFLYKSFGVVTFYTDEGCHTGFFIKDFVTINNEPIDSNVALSDVFTCNSIITVRKESVYFVNDNMYYISVIYVNGLRRAMTSKCNTCSICGEIIKKPVGFPVVKHLNGVAGVVIDFRDDNGLLECGLYKAIFHKSELFLSGKKLGASQVLSDVIHKGMKFHFVAVVTEGDWYGIYTSHVCTCVWDSQKPSVNTVMESYITDAADGDMLDENVVYFGIVTDIAPPSVAIVTIKTFGNSIPVLLFIWNLAVSKEKTMCTKDDWVNDYLTIGDKLKVKIASKTKNYKFRAVSEAWKTNEAFAVKNVKGDAVNENTPLANQNSSPSFENQVQSQMYSKDESCEMQSKTDISHSSDSCSSSVDLRSKGINGSSLSVKTVEEGSYLFREKVNMELSSVDSDVAEETIVTHPAYNAFAKDSQTPVSNLESLGSMLVVGSLLWKEFVAKESETTYNLSDCRFTDAEVTAIQPVSETTAVLTVTGPCGPVRAFFNDVDAYNIDANSNESIYCTAIKLPEIGRFEETHAVWLLWQGMPPAVHEVFSVFRTEYSNALVLLDNVRYEGVIVGLLPPYVGLMKIALSSSVSVPVLIHVNALTACKEISFRHSSGSWIIDYVSVGDTLIVSVESTKNTSLKEIGIKSRVKKVWKNNVENLTTHPLMDDVCTLRGVVSAVYSGFGVITFEFRGCLKRALFFKDQTNMNWQELKTVVTSKAYYEVSFHVKPECFNPKSILWLASNVTRVEECESCPPEDSYEADGVDSFIKNKKIIAYVEKLEPNVGLAVFKLCGKYERAIFPYTQIFCNGVQIEPKSALTVLRKDMQLNIKIRRITNSEQETVKFITEYVEIQPCNETEGSGTKVITSLTNLLMDKLDVTSKLENLKGKIKYNELGTGIIEFKYKNEDFEVAIDQSTDILMTAQGSRSLSDLWPTGTTVHFNLLCNNSMTKLSVECVWGNKKPKKVVYKNAPELLPVERNSVKSGGMYPAKITQIKKFSFVAEIQMEDFITSVFVPNTSFHPFSDTRKLSRDECVALHVNKGDVVYVVVERSKYGAENEWISREAWKEAANDTPAPSATLQLLRNSQTGEEAQIVTLSPTEGQLKSVSGIVLSFVHEHLYLFGLPVKNVDLTDILSLGDTVNFSVTEGSSTVGEHVCVSKVWIGCYEILSFAETYGAIAQYRSSRGWKPHVFEELMKELGKHRQPGKMVEQLLQINQNVSEDVCSPDDILESAIGSKLEQHDDFPTLQPFVPKTENRKLSAKGNTNRTVPAHSTKSYASTVKENVIPCGSAGYENSHNKNASVLDSDLRGIMEMSLSEIMCAYHGDSSPEFSSHVLHSLEKMVQKELLNKFLPAAISNTVKYFAVDTNETLNFQEANQTDAWISRIANMWKSRLQVLLENHFRFSDDELSREVDLEIPSNNKTNSGEMCERTNDTLQNMPVVRESGTQTTSTGKVIYLNIYADANKEESHT